MEASSFQQHVASINGRSLAHNQDIENGVGGRDTYKVSFPLFLTSVACLMEGCPLRSNIPGRVRDYFMY